MNKEIGALLGHLLDSEDAAEAQPIVDAIKDGLMGPVLAGNIEVSEGLRYHIDNNIPLSKPIFRLFSDEYFSLIKEAKELFNSGKLIVCADSEWMIQGNFGKFAEFEGNLVPLDIPMKIDNEALVVKNAAEYKGKKVNLRKPRTIRKGEPGYKRKQYVVYVKDGDKVKRITFGDPNLKAKPEHAKNRKSFRARHKCDKKDDPTTAGYWACRHPPNW